MPNLKRLFERELVSLNRIEVSKSAILENLKYYQSKFEGEVWPVLKANAYGHGLEQVAEILKKEKLRYVVADSYYEALRIWKVNPNQHILLIGSTHPSNLGKLNFEKIAVMVQDAETIDCLGKLGKKVKVHLKVDTGMGRQGVAMNDLRSMIYDLRKYKNIEVEGVMSHLADADNEDGGFTKIQIKRFEEVKRVILESGLRPKYWHLAATYGIDKMPHGLTNAARLGIGLYTKVKPAMRVITTITLIKEVNKGEKISYNGTFVAPKKMRVGIVPMGYFEGLDRRLSNTGNILGRVCMNLTVMAVDEKAKAWDELVMDNADNMAKICGTIPYEILVGWNGSIRRVVV